MTQTTIFDRAERAKQEGMEVSYRNADSQWKKMAVEHVKHLINAKEEFTAEEVVMHLNELGIFTGENRAMGAIMQSFHRAGQIKPWGFSESKRPECHKSPVRVWKSLIYKERG